MVIARPGGVGGGGHFGGVSSGHVSEQGLTSTNGPNASDRDKGLERAEDRMSQQGIEHQKAMKQLIRNLFITAITKASIKDTVN